MHLGNSISSKENCLEETLFRKIKNSIERLGYMKKFFLNALSILMVILAVSCSAALDEAARGDLRIKIVESRSVMPQYPEVDSYSVSLTAGSQTVGPQTFGVDDDIVIKDILVGSYTLTVEGLEDNLPVLSKTQTVKISPNGTDVAITLDFLSEGTGTVIIPISWADISNPSPLLEAAIDNKDLGFQAFFTEGNTPLTEEIQWATEEDFEKKSMTYIAEGVKNAKDANVYFKIFMKGEGSESFAVARAFDTKITVYPNLVSKPDANENENFTIGDSTIDYIFNVQNPKSVATPGHEATSVDITWEYPNLWGTYSGKVIVRLLASDGSDINKTQEAAFSNEDKSNNKVAFDNLDATETYKVSFQIVLDDGGVSEEEILLNNVHVEASVTSISFTGLNDSYVMGDSAELEVTVLPEHAVDKTYTITHNGNDGDITIVGNKLTFNRSGDYTINVKSNDKTVADKGERLSADSVTVTVKLAAPSSFKAENGDDGIVLTWDAVDSADGYKITRTENNSTTKGGEEVITGTRYEDTAGIRLSTKYDYTIQAVRNHEDGKFDSTTSSANITTLEPSVSIELPSKDIFNTENLTPFLSGIKSQVLTTENQIAIQIKSPIEGATYTWYLNGHKIETNSSTDFIISVENYGNYLKGLSAVTENTLRLEVSKNGKISSGTTTFLFATVISDADITGITVTEGDANKVVLGSPITLSATISDNSKPEIRWTSSNGSVATVDQTGVVTAVNDGTATITAEIISNGSKKSIDVTTYIPAENIVITNETGRDFMFMRKDGVTVESGFDTVTLKAVATRNDELTISEAAKVITWSVSSESINLSAVTGETVNVNSVDKTSGGDFQILAETAEVKNTSTTVHVHDMDIYMKKTSQGDESYNKVTGSKQNTSAGTGQRNYNLKLVYASYEQDSLHDNNSNGLNVIWCFDGNENSQEVGTPGFYLTLFNQNVEDSDFTVEMERDTWTSNSPQVMAIMKVGESKACAISFTADA